MAPEPVEVETRRRFRLRELQSICDEFEKDWKAGGAPALDRYLAAVAPDQRTELLSELLPLELAYRRERQEALPAEHYLALLPEFSEPVRQILREQASRQDTNGCADTQTPLGDRPKSKDATVVRLGRFGSYELLSEIGRGGMGVVYKAHQPSLDRIVAIKTIVAGVNAPAIFVERFLTEARLAGKLNHPGIVPIYEIGQVEGQHFFSMEYVEGRTLSELVETGGVSPLRAAGLVASVAEIVHFAHERGVLHRDLKPSNVIVGEAGRVRVMDFGLAKQIEGQTLTLAGEILGTPSFMPPEQARGEWSKVDRRSDVYSLGAVLYSLLTGRPPFKGESAMATIMDVIQCEPTTPRQVRPELDPELERICLKCLAKSSSARYSTAAELMRELDDYVQGGSAKTDVGLPPPSPEQGSHPQPAAAEGASIPLRPLALGGGMLALLVLAAVFFLQAPQGTLRVEINDPSIEVSVKGSDVVLKQRGKEEISLAPGKHALIVKRGDFTFETKELVLKNGDRTTIQVELLPGEVRVATAEGTPLGSAPLRKGPASERPKVAAANPPRGVKPPAPGGGDAEGIRKPRAVGRLLFKDDFDAPLPMLHFFNADQMKWEYVKGRGRLTSTVAGLVGFAYAQPVKDFVAEYGFEPEGEPRGTSYGFFFRSEVETTGFPNYYVMLVDPAQERVHVMCWQRSWTLVESYPIPAGLLAEGRANNVRIEAAGTEFAVFLNDQFACRWTDDKLTGAGLFGFFVSGPGEKRTVSFGKLRIFALADGDPPAAAPPVPPE